MATVGDVLRATLSGTMFGIDALNMVFHYEVVAGTELSYTTIANAIGSALNSAFAGMEGQLSDKVDMDTLDLSEWDFVDNEFDGKATAITTSLIGTNAGANDINGACVVMRFITEELRRQARKFVPGILEANVTNNGVDALMLTPAIATAALLNDDIVAGAATLRPCTFNSDPLSPRFETSSLFVQTAFVNSLVGYQRRRQPGSGA